MEKCLAACCVPQSTRVVQPVATCRQSPYLHKPAIVIMTSISFWRHWRLSWPRPPLRTYGHLTAFNIQRYHRALVRWRLTKKHPVCKESIIVSKKPIKHRECFTENQKKILAITRISPLLHLILLQNLWSRSFTIVVTQQRAQTSSNHTANLDAREPWQPWSRESYSASSRLDDPLCPTYPATVLRRSTDARLSRCLETPGHITSHVCLTCMRIWLSSENKLSAVLALFLQ